MGINGVGANDYVNQATQAYEANQAAQKEAAQAVVEQETEKTDDSSKYDGFKKPPYKPDVDKLNSMKSEMNGNVAAFNKMVQGMLQKQGSAAAKATNLKELFENVTISAEEKLAAQQSISEDGEWGVEATANRILDFAKALSGGDPSKFDELKNAVEKGFKEAEKVWGGKMPSITGETYERVMQGFDSWEKELKGDN